MEAWSLASRHSWFVYKPSVYLPLQSRTQCKTCSAERTRGRSILAPSVSLCTGTALAVFYKRSDPVCWCWSARSLQQFGSGGPTKEGFFFNLFFLDCFFFPHKMAPVTLFPGYTSLSLSASLLGRDSSSAGRGPDHPGYLLALCLSWARLISQHCICETSPKICPYDRESWLWGGEIQTLRGEKQNFPEKTLNAPGYRCVHTPLPGSWACLLGMILVLLPDYFDVS